MSNDDAYLATKTQLKTLLNTYLVEDSAAKRNICKYLDADKIGQIYGVMNRQLNVYKLAENFHDCARMQNLIDALNETIIAYNEKFDKCVLELDPNEAFKVLRHKFAAYHCHVFASEVEFDEAKSLSKILKMAGDKTLAV